MILSLEYYFKKKQPQTHGYESRQQRGNLKQVLGLADSIY